MKKILALGLLTSFILPLCAQELAMQNITPPLSDAPLKNPGMGLYLGGTLNEKELALDLWPAQVIDIGYFRDDWAKIQPHGPGTADFDAYFKPIFDLWVNKLHKRVAFRLMSQNMHSQSKYVSPQWVFEAGVPSQTFKGIYAPEQTDPVFWDEKYLQIQEKFIADLGHYLDGRPGVEFIDIGGIGEWGEMHLARWTPTQLAASGYTPEKYVAAYRRLIDAYAKAFPHTRVFLNVGDWANINDYAAIRGVHFRQDGLNPNGPSADVGKRFYHEYARRGTICNYELFSGYDEMKQKGWGVKETFDKGLEDPISYLHVNLMGFGQMAKAPAEVREAVTDAARRLGFRFAATSVKCNPKIHVNPDRAGRLLLESRWKNSGVAPCYDSYALRWFLLNAHGQSVAEKLSFPTVPTTRWWPGEEISQTDVLTIPAATPPGAYKIFVAMEKPEEATKIQLALRNSDAQGRYFIADIAAEPGQNEPKTIYNEGFEKGVGGWQSAKGIALKTDEAGHEGAALLLDGAPQEASWNYASLSLPKAILPGSRYHLSCWMKVDALTPGSPSPYMKIGLNDKDGKWLTNINTDKYDTTKLGTWQKLDAWIETTSQTTQGALAIEKGTLESRPQITLRLDELSLEIVESP